VRSLSKLLLEEEAMLNKCGAGYSKVLESGRLISKKGDMWSRLFKGSRHKGEGRRRGRSGTDCEGITSVGRPMGASHVVDMEGGSTAVMQHKMRRC
jgi:hypothetical protein